MASVEQEFSFLVRKSNLTNKYTIKALEAIACTNDHCAQDIVSAINTEIFNSSDENKEALLSLLKTLAQNPSYYFIKQSRKKRQVAAETNKAVEGLKKRKIQAKKDTQDIQASKEKMPEKAEVFFPFPPEYLLFKLVDKATYKKSYELYTKGLNVFKFNSNPASESESPKLTREYLIVPRLEQAVKLLYTADMQCKVCGMRFNSQVLYTAHADNHQKKTQMGRSVDVPMWRAWLLEPAQRSSKGQKIPVGLKTMVQEKVPTVPVRGDREQKCTICGDGFEVIWSDEIECWAFNDALVIRTTPRQISHKRCVS